MAYTRAEDVQIDAWQEIGNSGWNWTTLFPYYLKSEDYQVPNSTDVAAGASYNLKYHGFDGPLKVGHPPKQSSDLPGILNTTYQSLGVPWTADTNGGKMRGFNYVPFTIDHAQNVREDAARAYYWPFTSLRSNIDVLTNTRADKIVWKDETPSNETSSSNRTIASGDAVADGVQITASNGNTSVIKVSKEVILAAGSLRSPAILELSGVGNPRSVP